ncbi:MAG: TatD family hydrolase [Myxococcota bacterium]
MNAEAAFDAHVHLDFLASHERAVYRERAQTLGVHAFAIPGVSPDQWAEAIEASEPGDAVGVGLHPEYFSAPEDVRVDRLRSALRRGLEAVPRDRMRFVGETGLDARMPGDQASVLRVHLAVASEAKHPVVLHVVRRHEELLRALSAFPDLRTLVHGFVGSAELAARYVAQGARLGLGRRALRSPKTRAAVEALGPEPWLLESDEPGAPDDLFEVAAWAANVLGESSTSFCARSGRAARAFFAM